MHKIIAMLVLLAAITGCTEEGVRQGGHDMLSGLCKNSANCTVNCAEGQKPDAFGHCVPSSN